jgi:hypothetical protein
LQETDQVTLDSDIEVESNSETVSELIKKKKCFKIVNNIHQSLLYLHTTILSKSVKQKLFK